MDQKKIKRIRRHKRIRRKIFGTKTKPRFCVFRSLANIYAQLIDDIDERTLLSVSTADKDFKKKVKGSSGNVKAAAALGEVFAEEAKKKGISEVVFDRAGFLYHGRVRALAESARKHGLKF